MPKRIAVAARKNGKVTTQAEQCAEITGLSVKTCKELLSKGWGLKETFPLGDHSYEEKPKLEWFRHPRRI